MKNKQLWMSVGGIVLLVAAFLSLNFRLAASSTRADRFTITMKLPAPQQQNESIKMLVTGDGSLASALQEALLENLDQAGLSGVEPVRELDAGDRNPVLLVNVERPGPLWTPVFAMSRFRVQAGYASDGDTAFMEAIEKTRTGTSRKNVANMYAEFDLNDRSLGLISRPGYHQFLADYLAREIVSTLQELYKG